MKYTDVAVGPMTDDEIGRVISHYLKSKQPSKLLVNITRQEDGKFYTKIYMPEEDFIKKRK